MDFLICDKNRMELMELPIDATVDFDIGETNDVELVCRREDGIESGMYLICPGTEYGAILEEIEEDTSDIAVTFRGDAFRGFLSQFIIEPPSGEDYRTVSGDANTVMQNVLDGAFDGMFEISGSSGINISNYQFARYTDALTGFADMLEEKDARIQIEIIQGGANEAFSVRLSAVPIQNLTKTIEYSQDSSISVLLNQKNRGITHVICLGQGELKDRTVLHLYLQSDGTVGTRQYYTGLYERTETYDYSSAEDEDELIKGGTERLLENAPSQKIQMTVNDDEDIDIGDIIAGRNYETGLYVDRPVLNKILKIENGLRSIEYKVEGS